MQVETDAMRVCCWAVVSLLLASCAPVPEAQTSAEPSIRAPRFFIADSLGPTCVRDEQGKGPNAEKARAALEALYRNHVRYIEDLRQSTSLSTNHDSFSENWTPILFNSYAAAASGDVALARTITDGLRQLAQGRRYLNEPRLLTRTQALALGGNYAQGPQSPGYSHVPRFVGRMYVNLLIATAVLQSFMTVDDRTVILPWLEEGYRKFIQPELAADQGGIYDFANNGMAVLALASLSGDMALARREFNERRREFLSRIESSGYIDQNSFRGVRGFWYHTYGLDPALSYAILARAWGYDFLADPLMASRLRAAVEKTALGIRDHGAFREVGNKGRAFSSDPRDTRDFVHQFSLNLYRISREEFGVSLPPSRRHFELRRTEEFTRISGFSADCFYSSSIQK